jgi:hypothetical protein
VGPPLISSNVLPSIVVSRKWAITSVAVVLAVVAYFVGCVGYYAYWVDGYEVTVHLRRIGDCPVVGIVVQPMYPQTFQWATNALGSAPKSSPRYFGLLDIKGRRPEPVEDEDAPIAVQVTRHGKDETFPRRKRVHEFRQEKLALGVFFADGTSNCYIYDIPAPDAPPDITAEVSAGAGEPLDAADSR